MQRLCPRCSGPGLESDLSIIPLSLIPFPVISPVLSYGIKAKRPRKYLKNKIKMRLAEQ